MIINNKESERRTIMLVADKMITAIRTAPKAHGQDSIVAMALTGEEKDKLARITKALGEEGHEDFMIRDSKIIKLCPVVILVGVKNEFAGVNEACQFCGFENCAACEKAGANCALKVTDLGVAVGSAVSIAADNRVDNRVFFSAGKSAVVGKFFKEDPRICYAIPLYVSGKSIFFDRVGTPQFQNVIVD